MRSASIALLTLGMIGAAQAEQYPFREMGPARNSFMESAVRQCFLGWTLKLDQAVIAGICECSASQMAEAMTLTDVEEMFKGGLHRTPRLETVMNSAADVCVKLIIGH